MRGLELERRRGSGRCSGVRGWNFAGLRLGGWVRVGSRSSVQRELAAVVTTKGLFGSDMMSTLSFGTDSVGWLQRNAVILAFDFAKA